MSQISFRSPNPILILPALLLLVLVCSLSWGEPAQAGGPAAPPAVVLKTLSQQGQLTPTPYPLAEMTPLPYPFDLRPVERNPYLVSGGVLIFAVIVFALLKYSRPREKS
jgi:hypothetical protein